MLEAPQFSAFTRGFGSAAQRVQQIAWSMEVLGKVAPVSGSPSSPSRDTKPKRHAAAAKAKRKAQRAARKRQRR